MRALLTGYVYPYGAQSYDTGEYMLGDVAVNVVLMESNPTLAPYDNNLPSDPVNPGRGSLVEDWTAEAITTVKSNVTAGLEWWKTTLQNMFPNAPANLLNFHYNWQYADNPVQTGYEPISRPSDDFFVPGSSSGPRGWIYDFFNEVGFDYTGNFSQDIRFYNDYTRQIAGTDWAFTIFVVNNAADSDKFFASGGTFSQAFAYAGGRFMVVPASRPASTYAHEAAHQFWAIDQYAGGGTYASQRGYYNTPNLNAADNPQPGFQQANSIMARDEVAAVPPRLLLSNAYNSHTTDPYALAQIGWKDSDGDGIFDVIDVPFTLSGSGSFNVNTGIYTFNGSTGVNTLPNLNSSGGGSDITINQINVIQASVDGGSWFTVKTFDPRTYQANFTVEVNVGGPGIHEVRLRSADLRTTVTSGIFSDDVETPTDPPAAVNGIVFRDLNGDGVRGASEPAMADVGIEVLDLNDQPLDFVRNVEPNLYAAGMLLNGIASSEGVTISALGANVAGPDVFGRFSTITGGNNKVFESTLIGGAAGKVWNANQKLRVDFATPVSTVSLKALRGSTTGASYGRLEAYNSSGELLTRFNTNLISSSVTMTVSRNAGDIAYVVAYGRLGTDVVLDTLEWGATTSSTSGATGAYSLAGLPDGSYHVRVIAPVGYMVTTPPQGFATVTVVNSQSAGSVDFGIATERNRFHNVDNPFNVNNDVGNIISPIDVLMIINYINAHNSAQGEIASGEIPANIGFVDVNDDGFCAPNDALAVINVINAARASGQGGEGSGGEGGSANDDSLVGETRVAVPGSAADYFAQTRGSMPKLRGDDEPCSCGRCVSANTDAAFADFSGSMPAAANLSRGWSPLDFSSVTAKAGSQATIAKGSETPVLTDSRRDWRLAAKLGFLARKATAADDARLPRDRDASEDATGDDASAT